MPRKRKLSDEGEEGEQEDVENGVRAKRKAAIEARAKTKDAAADSDEENEEDEEEDEEDDDNDEDYEGGDGDDDEEVVEDEKKKEDGAGEEEDEGEEDDEEVDADAIKVDCVEATLEEPTKDVPGYVLKRAEVKQRLEMWFSEEMSETVGDISEAFYSHFENKKLPVLHIIKYDVIEERPEIYQIDVLEAKYDKAYDIRETESVQEEDKEGKQNLAHDFFCLVRVEDVDKTWATQYFMPEED